MLPPLGLGCSLAIIGIADYLDFREGQHNWLLFILCWIVRLYHRIGRIEETEKSEGNFGGTLNLFVCATDLEFQTSQQIICRIFLVRLYLMDLILDYLIFAFFYWAFSIHINNAFSASQGKENNLSC